MKLSKVSDGKIISYDFTNTFDLESKLKTKKYQSISKSLNSDRLIFSFKTSSDFKRLRLLVILSPIFIASFDRGKDELEFFKATIKDSNFSYGLYDKFFQDFNFKTYLDFYHEHEKLEDIMVDKNLNVSFIINPMEDKYILALAALIEGLVLDDKTSNMLLDYFAKIRNDIVINGRRSILANGIQAFYLSKYLVAWALDLYKIIESDHKELYRFVKPIFELSNNLKTISGIN